MEMQPKISQFLDDEERITQLPRKRQPRLAVLEYLARKFEPDQTYTERQVNELCNRWHTFGDCVLIRRELVDNGFLGRERDGSRYWRIWEASSIDKEPTDSI